MVSHAVITIYEEEVDNLEQNRSDAVDLKNAISYKMFSRIDLFDFQSRESGDFFLEDLPLVLEASSARYCLIVDIGRPFDRSVETFLANPINARILNEIKNKFEYFVYIFGTKLNQYQLQEVVVGSELFDIRMPNGYFLGIPGDFIHKFGELVVSYDSLTLRRLLLEFPKGSLFHQNKLLRSNQNYYLGTDDDWEYFDILPSQQQQQQQQQQQEMFQQQVQQQMNDSSWRKLFRSKEFFDDRTVFGERRYFRYQEEPEEYTVWYATNRQRDTTGKVYFNALRNKYLQFGNCSVLIPKSHKIGTTKSKRWFRIWRKPDEIKILTLKEMSQGDFVGGLRNISADSFNKADGVLFIHGYNVSFTESIIRAAQLGFDLQVKGPMAVFSWPSKGHPGAYNADSAAIGASEEYIVNFLKILSKETGIKKLHIIAHSMGNIGLARSIQRICDQASDNIKCEFGHLVLAAPDIDVDQFKSFSKNFINLADRTTLYVSKRDQALALSGMAHMYPRVGIVPPVTIVNGIDTIHVGELDMSFLGHGYVSNHRVIITDIHDIIINDLHPASRSGLSPVKINEEKYWEILP